MNNQDINQDNRYKTGKKKHQQLDGTSANKLKVTQTNKSRLSNRKSIISKNIAPIVFHSLLIEDKKEKRESQGSTVDLELLKMLDQQYEKTKSNSITLTKDIQEVNQLKNQIAKAKIFRQQVRETYIENFHLIKSEREYFVKISDTYPLKKQLTDLEHEEKKYIYEFTSKEEELRNSIKQAKQQTERLNAILDQNLIYFSSVTEKVKEIQLKKADLALALAKKKQVLEEAKHNYNMQQSQIFVLKIQTNSNLCCGMIYNKIGINRKLLLQKDYFQWDKLKQKKLTFEDLKRFVLIQLCHGWKTMLRKLSYQSSQYQVLFGEAKNEAVLEDLRRFLSYDKMRSSYKKSPKAIIFYSEAKVQADRKQKILNLFQKFDNGIIRINNAQFIEFDGVFELQICYTYLNDCELKQRFTFEEHNYLNKEKIVKDLKSTERRTFLLIEIPFVALRQDLIRYDEVFELIRKKTGNR